MDWTSILEWVLVEKNYILRCFVFILAYTYVFVNIVENLGGLCRKWMCVYICCVNDIEHLIMIPMVGCK